MPYGPHSYNCTCKSGFKDIHGNGTLCEVKCPSGEFRNTTSGLCEVSGPTFQSELKIVATYTAELDNPNSPEFLSLAADVENALLTSLKQTLPGVVDVQVYSFRPGSVIAEYNVVMSPNAQPVSPVQVQSAVTSAVSGGLPGLNVDTSFIPSVVDASAGPGTLKGSFLQTSVVCDSQGFKPVFSYHVPSNEAHEIAIDIDIGGLNQTDCVSAMSTETTTGLVTFIYSNFSSSYTEHIPYMENTTQPRCGGLFQHWNDISDSNKEVIKYEVNVTAVVTRTFRSKIERKTQYPFILKCLLERELSLSSNNSFQVLEELVDARTVDRASDTFTFDASIKFYDETWTDEVTQSIVTPKNNEKLYLEVKQAENQALFKFVVNKCYATRGPTVSPDDTDPDKDVFFKDQCPEDETVGFNRTQNGEFQFSILSFSFVNPANTIYFHCDIYVCLKDNSSTPCMQKAQSDCNSKRRRRSVEGVDYDYQKTITAAKPVLLEGSQVNAPSCGEGFLYDRELRICSQKNILEVQNIRLSQDVWRKEYANTFSLAFKELAKIKEYQLWVLIKTTRQNKIIHGVKVLRARPGSVIIDVAIKYSDSVTAEQAFTTFKQLLYTPASITRVQNILQISNEKVIEYVPVMRNDKTDTEDSEKLILIVVVVVLFVIIFIAGLALFKARQVRQRSTTLIASGFDNMGVDA